MKYKYFISIFAIVISLLSFQSLFSQIFWEEKNSGVNVSLNSVSDINASNVWICGDSGTVLRSTNSGYNWYNVSGNGIPSNIKLVNIFGITPATAITSGYKDSNTFVYRTSNSGANWYQVFSQDSGFINSIWIKSDSNNGFMQGNPVNGRWSLWKTSDGGLNWDSSGLFLPQSGNELGWQNSMWRVGNKIWFGTNNSRIYYSDSSGYNWTIINTSPGIINYTVWMDNSPSLIGFCAGTSLLRTSNAGLNWSLITAPGTGNIYGITGNILFVNYFWYVREGSIYDSWGGSSWNIDYTAPSGTYNHIAALRIPLIFGPGFLFAVRNNGGISRGNYMVEGVRIISKEIPSSYNLYQNYPNPFNSSTKIKFDSRILPASGIGEIRGGNIRLTIYNMLGQKVSTLVNKIIQPGTYEIGWDGKNSPSGIYFYRFTITDPNRTNVVYDKIMKMVMIR